MRAQCQLLDGHFDVFQARRVLQLRREIILSGPKPSFTPVENSQTTVDFIVDFIFCVIALIDPRPLSPTRTRFDAIHIESSNSFAAMSIPFNFIFNLVSLNLCY